MSLLFSKEKTTVWGICIIFILLFLSLSCLNSFQIYNKEKFDQKVLSLKQTDYGNASSESKSSSITAPVINALNQQSLNADPFILGSTSQLINKKHGLPQDYEPSDLTLNELPGMRDTYLRKEAADALVELFNAASEQGLDMQCCSGYRSYYDQVDVFDQEAAINGQAAAEVSTAPPGYSEHQSGLCIDLTSNSVGMTLTQDFVNTPEGAWLDQNAWRFGFIIRYPKGKESITGYEYEPWHIRYLGKELSEKVFNSGQCYEEYLNMVEQ